MIFLTDIIVTTPYAYESRITQMRLFLKIGSQFLRESDNGQDRRQSIYQHEGVDKQVGPRIVYATMQQNPWRSQSTGHDGLEMVTHSFDLIRNLVLPMSKKTHAILETTVARFTSPFLYNQNLTMLPAEFLSQC